MSAVADLLNLDAPVDFQRDHLERPLIVPADGGAPIPYTRCSSAAKTIDDTYNLELWARRNVAYGMAHDGSLVARVLALGGTPYTWENEDKKAVNAIVVDAAKVAQAHKGADIGTALHRMAERRDRGEDVAAGPFAADLDAYVAALQAAGLSTHRDWIECRMVSDDLQMAGTCDRILVRGDEHYIADIKTGSIDYGGLGFAAQLASYAHGVLYDPEREKRLDTPTLNRERGIIIHVPAGEGTCTLHWVDLVAGYEAALLANRVREVRRQSSHWITPLEDHAALMASLSMDFALVESGDRLIVEAAALRARLNAAVTAGAHLMRWPADVLLFRHGGPTTWAQLLEVERCVRDAEREVGGPFAEPLPADPNERPSLALVTKPAEGGADAAASVSSPALGAPDLDALKALHDALPEDLQAAAYGAVMAAGISSDRRTWTVDHLPTIATVLDNATAEHGKRKVRILSALNDLDEDVAVAVLLTVTGGEAPVLDAFRHDQAEQLEALCEAMRREPCPLVVDDEALVCNAVAEVAILRPFGGSKAEALAAAKELAGLHGRPKPRSVAQAAVDPILVALVIASDAGNATSNQQGA